jgi:hypothetical protein
MKREGDAQRKELFRENRERRTRGYVIGVYTKSKFK